MLSGFHANFVWSRIRSLDRNDAIGVAPPHRPISYTVVTESGLPIRTLFDKSTANDVIVVPKHLVLQRSLKPRNCRPPSNYGLLSLLNPPAVQATECTSGECGGSYMGPYSLPCGESCGGEYFEWFYSDSTKYGPWEGWRYDGGTVCPEGCFCRETGCSV